jgi:hypothetical protein
VNTRRFVKSIEKTIGGIFVAKHPCKDCEERYEACWDTCPLYKEYYEKLNAKQDAQKKKDSAVTYLKSKDKYYKTDYGWRK